MGVPLATLDDYLAKQGRSRGKWRWAALALACAAITPLSWWRFSPWPMKQPRIAINGRGAVVASSGGRCDDDGLCSLSFSRLATSITLTAWPAGGRRIAWGGACAGSVSTTCVLSASVAAAQLVEVTFTEPPPPSAVVIAEPPRPPTAELHQADATHHVVSGSGGAPGTPRRREQPVGGAPIPVPP